MSIEQIICEIEKQTPIGPSTNARPKTEIQTKNSHGSTYLLEIPSHNWVNSIFLYVYKSTHADCASGGSKKSNT